jgi:hypothetical protein
VFSFPKIVLDKEKEEECIICTEHLINARKLACSHHFHLICLSKWIEKGNKNCPICRKEIDLTTSQDLNSNQSRGIWSYGIRLDGRFFSWLPNLTFRIVRVNEPANVVGNIRNINDNLENSTS